MKRYVYWFSLSNKDKEIGVEGTSITNAGAVLVVKDGEDEVARYIQKEVQGYRRTEL